MGFMSEEAARNWCEKATTEYQISIEDFARRVHIYIEQKGKNHHVVFLVDEIGQYMIYLKNLEEQIHLGNKEFSNRYVIFSKVESLHLICENINIGFEKFNVNKYSVKLFKERY